MTQPYAGVALLPRSAFELLLISSVVASSCSLVDGSASEEATSDCPSFDDVTRACNQQGLCWTVYERGGSDEVEVEFAVASEEGSAAAKSDAACNVRCQACSEMASSVNVPNPQDELERAVLSLAEQECQRWYSCEPYFARRMAGEREHCVAELNGRYLFVATLPRSGLNLATVTTCSAELAGATCSESVKCFEGTAERVNEFETAGA